MKCGSVAGRAAASGGGVTTLLSEDFSGTLTTNFNGDTTSVVIVSGTLQCTGEGFVLSKTSMGTGNKWMRFTLTNPPTSDSPLFIALGDSSGNLRGWSFALSAGTLSINYTTRYDTYGTWVSDVYLGVSVGSFTSGQVVGVTFEQSTHVIRAWANVSAATPDSVSSWDGVSAGGSSSTETFVANSNYVGAGCYTSSGTGTQSIDNLTAGSV